MKSLPMQKGVAWGVGTAFIFGAYIILSKYLLPYFSSAWLLLASGIGIVLLIPSAIQRRSIYSSWGKREWSLVLAMALFSGLFNFSILLSINFLPASIATMFIGLSSVTLLIRTCMMGKRKPLKLEVASVLFAVAGAFLLLGVKIESYSLVGIAFGVCTLVFGTNAVILTGRMRKTINPKEVVLTKQLSKILFGCIGLVFASTMPSPGSPGLGALWVLLLVSGGLKMLESFTASKTAFKLPPVVYRNILLLNLPIVGLAESWLFGIHLDPYQWFGILLILLSGLAAIFSGEERLQAI